MASGDFDLVARVSEMTVEQINVVDIFSKPFNVIIGNSIVENIFTAMSSVGIALMLVYFFIDLEEVAVRQNFNLEMLVKNLAKFIIGLAVINNIGPLLNWFNEFTTAIMGDLSGMTGALSLTPVMSSAKGVANAAIKTSSETEELKQLAMILLVSIFSLFIKCVLWGVAIKRAIELGVYYAFSPLIYADVFSDGLSGVVKKLKPFFALYLQLPYVLIIVALAEALISSVATPITTWSAILLVFIILKSLKNSISQSKEELERFLES